jgi:hypothetical protein
MTNAPVDMPLRPLDSRQDGAIVVPAAGISLAVITTKHDPITIGSFKRINTRNTISPIQTSFRPKTACATDAVVGDEAKR